MIFSNEKVGEFPSLRRGKRNSPASVLWHPMGAVLCAQQAKCARIRPELHMEMGHPPLLCCDLGHSVVSLLCLIAILGEGLLAGCWEACNLQAEVL